MFTGFTVFAEDGTEEAFALDAMGEEMATGEGVVNQVAYYIPFGQRVAWQDVGSEFLTDPTDVLFVLEGVVGTGAVDHQSTWTETGPDSLYDVTLPLGTHLDILQGPIADGSFVLTEHAFA